MMRRVLRASAACAIALGLIGLAAACEEAAVSRAALDERADASGDPERDGQLFEPRIDASDATDDRVAMLRSDASTDMDTREDETPHRVVARDGGPTVAMDAALGADVDRAQDAAEPCDGGSCPVACVATCAGHVPFSCTDAGVLEPSEPCGVPAHVCVDGQCVDNKTTYIGLSSATATQRMLEAKHLHATRFSTAGVAVLQELNVLGFGSGGFVRFAVYADREHSGARVPGALIASGIESVMIAGGAAQGTTPRGYVTLDAAASYWLVVMTSTTPSTLYTQTDAQSRLLRVALPEGTSFTDAFPDAFPLDEALAEEGLRYSLFVGVQTLP